MRWYPNDNIGVLPSLEVDCRAAPTIGRDYSQFKQCELSLRGQGILNTERDKQSELNKKKVRASQPATAPDL
jgi:hypothetical protein